MKDLDAVFIIDVCGTFAFAMSGVMSAIERKFDLFGTIILAFATALGGGTLRDVLIGSTPVAWMNSNLHIYIILSTIPLAYFFFRTLVRLKRTFFIFDTLGIGLFTVLGMEKAIEMGLSPLVSVMMGVVTAVFGGVIRDVLSSKVPLIFQKEIYAFACLSGALTYLGLNSLQANETFSLFFSVGVVITIRQLAIHYQWSIPFRPWIRMKD